jgi:hypothetical protein
MVRLETRQDYALAYLNEKSRKQGSRVLTVTADNSEDVRVLITP